MGTPPLRPPVTDFAGQRPLHPDDASGLRGGSRSFSMFRHGAGDRVEATKAKKGQEEVAMELLLISTGGSPFLEHVLPEIRKFLDDRTKVGFVTAALEPDKDIPDEAAYFERAKKAFARNDVAVVHVRWDDPTTYDFAALGVQAIVVGGGNTYQLLHRLHAHGLFGVIKVAVHDGMPYIGASAGANVAGHNILATNDWYDPKWAGPMDGFQFVPWTINPHFVSGKIPGAPHGEAREERIRGYHLRHANPVLGLPERTLVDVAGDHATIMSATGQSAYLFYPNREVIVCPPGTKIPRLA